MVDSGKASQNYLRITTLLVTLLGAACSLYLMFSAGSNQKSALLIGLFTVWVLAPYFVFFRIYHAIRAWPASGREKLYSSILFLVLFSLVIYSGKFNIPGTKPAFNFLVVPLGSLIIIGIVFLIVKRKRGW